MQKMKMIFKEESNFYSDRKWFERSRCCKKILSSKIIKTSSKINDITEAIQNGKSKSFLSRFF